MKRILMLAMGCASLLQAAFNGTVVNVSTGQPAAGVTVTLLQLGQGMSTAGTAKSDAAGKFTFAVDAQAQTPYMVQALFDGVTYNTMVAPGSPTTDLRVEVFSSASKTADAKVVQHMILLEPSSAETVVNESIIYNNSGKATFNDPAGTLRFYLPAAAGGKVQVRCSGPGGMPVQRPAEKTAQANVYSVKFPVRPGETRFDVNYVLRGDKLGTFETQIVHGGGPVRLIAPKGVTFSSDSLSNLGPEPRTQATIYELKDAKLNMKVEGTGSLRQAEAAESEPSAGSEDQGGGIEMKRARIYDKMYWILGLSGAILLLGLMWLYGRQPAAGKR